MSEISGVSRPFPPTGRTLRTAMGLAILAIVGLASLMAAPVEQLVPIDLPPLAVRALAIIQPAVLTFAALGLGLWLAPKVGLAAPYLSGARIFPSAVVHIRPALVSAVLVALVAGAVLAAYQLGIGRLGTGAPEALANFAPPLVTRVLYGGITEEIISRWGVMTLIVWITARSLGQKATPSPWVYWTAALWAALLFAAGHLPLLYAAMSNPPMTLLLVVIGLNTLVGTAFGWLYWRAGLEAAMLSHALTHLVAAGLLAALPLAGLA